MFRLKYRFWLVGIINISNQRTTEITRMGHLWENKQTRTLTSLWHDIIKKMAFSRLRASTPLHFGGFFAHYVFGLTLIISYFADE